jgi:hypothetical protein
VLFSVFPIICQMNPFHNLVLCFFVIGSHLCLGIHSDLLPLDFLTKILYAMIIFPLHATWTTNLVLIDLVILIIVLIILSEDYKL